ncbi:MAG: hypothetical protein MI673_06510 [Thiotrichales bacterium]|nr:hypothetical protein [Thiotrichales bacterium]
MKTIIPLLLLFSPAVFAEDKEEDKTITYKLGGKEYTVKESENPELAKFMDKIEEIAKQSGAAEEGEPLEAEAQAELEQKPAPVASEPEKPKLNATAQSAEDLYNKGDFENAYAHYKELSANGDDEASLMLAVMHSKGQGVEADEAAAHAWFTRSAEQGNSSAEEFVKNSRLSSNEKDESLKYYNEISKEFDEPEKAGSAQDTYTQIQRSSGATRQPARIARTDQNKLKVKTYKRKPAGSYDGTTARTYSSAPVKSYGHERFELEKQYKE